MTKNNFKYGAVLHKEINFRGDCSVIVEAHQKKRSCFDFNSPSSSIDIFRFNKDNPETSGDGIVFYNKPFGYKTGANAGYYELTPQAIRNTWSNKPNKIDFSDSYNYVDVPIGEKQLCGTFEDCPGSIKIQGNYLTILYAKQPQSQYPYCQVFYEDVPNLKEEEVIAVEGRELEFITIIPIK